MPKLVLKKAVALLTAALIVINVVPMGLAQAKMVSTDQAIDGAASADARAKVESFLLREDVQEQLVLLGIDPAEATSRVAGLTDEEVSQIAGRLDELPAGGDGLGVVVVAIVLIFLVLLITDLMGLTDVFPFVNKNRAQ